MPLCPGPALTLTSTSSVQIDKLARLMGCLPTGARSSEPSKKRRLQGWKELTVFLFYFPKVRTLIAVQQTSASTLGFAAVCLALEPEVQRLAHDEVVRVHKECAEQDLGPLERLNRLKYLERVIKETLRLYPITAVFGRLRVEDLVLPSIPTKHG